MYIQEVSDTMKYSTDELTALRYTLDAELRKTNPDTARIDAIVASILRLEARDVRVPHAEVKARYRTFRASHPTDKKQTVSDYAKIAACIVINLAILALTLLEQMK